MSEIASGAAGAWSYRTGAWFAVFGSRATILLPESQKDQVVSLWSLVDGGAGFDDVLDGLLASGLSRLPGFVLVSTDDGPTRILLRGQGVEAALTGDGEDVLLDGAASHTWVERSVAGVTALSVTVPGDTPAEEDAGLDFPIVGGLVRVSRVDHPSVAGATVVDADEAEDTDEPGAGIETAAMVTEMSAVPAADDLPAAPATPPPPPLPPVPAFPPVPPPPPLGGAHLAADDAPAAELVTPDGFPADLLEEPDADTTATSDDVLAEAAPFDDGPATEVMEVIGGDPLTDPLSDPVVEPVVEPEPQAEQTDEPDHAAPDGWVTPWDNPAPEDPLAEPDTPAVPPPSFPPLGGATEVAPAGWTPPPPVDSGVVDAPPLPIGSWEPVGGAVPPPPGVPGAPSDFAADHDGLTVAGAGEEPPVPTPGIPGQPPAPAVTQPVAQLLVSDGQTIVVDRAVLIGRAPEARRFTSTEQPTLITVPSRLHEISSTHVEVRPGTGADHGTAVVTDMGSTNGTVLVQPGLGPEDLKPGIAVQLIPGAIINLGDGITIQVTRP